ncbi:DUF4199 domain-containing protein [Ferruginibacter sp.]
MKKIVIVCGLIGGLIVSVLMLISIALCYKSGNFEDGMLYGYASMLLAFSLVFVGIKNYRDKYNSGFVSFGKAFKTGLFITLIASTIYVIAWMIDYYVFMPDFADKYAAHMLEKLKADGASLAEIAKQTKTMDNFSEMYKNPLLVALFTYAEILPVGLIVTLISAFILKRKIKPAV